MTAKFIVGDTRAVTATIPDGSVDLILTSPPFLALRSYLPADHPDKGLEIGSEANPAAFIDVLLALTAEWRRILAPHGSLVLELGDTYSGSGGAGGDYGENGWREGQQKYPKQREDRVTRSHWPLPKCLALVPELYRVALAYGINPLTGTPSPAGRWRVRNVVRWVRPNPPVGALGDKFRPATSDLVIACVAGDRWFDLDAVRVPAQSDYQPTVLKKNTKTGGFQDGTGTHGNVVRSSGMVVASNPAGAPPLDWWQIVPGGYSGAHYAVWPKELCERPIEAMCPRRVCRTCGRPSRRLTHQTIEYEQFRASVNQGEKRRGNYDNHLTNDDLGHRRGYGFTEDDSVARGDKYTTVGWSSCGCPNTDGLSLDGYHTGTGWRPGIVLDPFAGSGTTLVVAHGHSRDSIGIDLDPRNAELARERLGLFLEVEVHGVSSVA